MSTPRRSGTVVALLAATLVATTGIGVAWAAWTNGSRLVGQATAAFVPPTVVRAPHIAGTPTDRETLTAVDGLWSGLAPSATRAYQWFSCSSTVTNCTAIAGATGTTYAVPEGAIAAGTRFAVRERVTNGPNVADAVSIATEPQAVGREFALPYVIVTTAQPQLTAPTTITAGSTLSVTSGTWTGHWLGSGNPITLGTRSYAYQWLRCGPTGHTGTQTAPIASSAGCVNATGAGATTATYTVNAADVGQRLRVRVSASASATLGTPATGRIVSQATAIVGS
jgi:hypothetical protein